MSSYFNQGNYRRNISTRSELAELWFNRGLIWCYGFNHEEATRCFAEVIKNDPECAMGYWGLALANGPFYNKPWEWYGEEERVVAIQQCHQYTLQAMLLSANCSALEQKLIQAICLKHPSPQLNRDDTYDNWTKQYASAMQAVLSVYPDDLDVICLTAEALMNITPWKLWDIDKAIPARDAKTLQAIEILEHGFDIIKRDNLTPHPGLLHFYIHAIEMSPTPEKALEAADQLRDLCPQVGHLLHMPCHIDGIIGNYEAALIANDKAIEADLAYLALRGRKEFYMISCLHNYHFKVYAAMFLGKFNTAMKAADDIQSLISLDMIKVKEQYLGSTLEAYYSSRVHVLVRFGRWQDIVDADFPEHQSAFPITTIMLNYAKTISYAALGDIARAREFKAEFERQQGQIPDWHIMANNPTIDILAVAEAMMNGELEYHAGNYETGYEYLRKATHLSDHLAYSEPWPWMHPPRHALGALLLEQGHVEEALQHYRNDLGLDNSVPRCHRHPNNIWALHGYHECLTRSGRESEAADIFPHLVKASSHADISIKSSCCCRKLNPPAKLEDCV